MTEGVIAVGGVEFERGRVWSFGVFTARRPALF
jgi:hypothetical protein